MQLLSLPYLVSLSSIYFGVLSVGFWVACIMNQRFINLSARAKWFFSFVSISRARERDVMLL
jgi:hypothetical protein